MYPLILSFSIVSLHTVFSCARVITIPVGPPPSLVRRDTGDNITQSEQWNNVTAILDFFEASYWSSEDEIDESPTEGSSLVETTKRSTTQLAVEQGLQRRDDGKKDVALQKTTFAGTTNAFYHMNAELASQRVQPLLWVDTAKTSNFFVVGRDCDETKGCKGAFKYENGGKLQGSQHKFSWGPVSCTAALYTDDGKLRSIVTIADLTASDLDVFSISSVNNWLPSEDTMGILGLANSGLPRAPRSNRRSIKSGYLEKIIAQEKIKDTMFSLGLVNGRAQLTLGGFDKALGHGPVTTLAVLPGGAWEIPLDAITVNFGAINRGTAGPQTKGRMLVDSGTPLIELDIEAASAVFKKIPGSFPVQRIDGATTAKNKATYFAYPCDHNPRGWSSKQFDVAFVFGGQEFKLRPTELKMGQLTPGGALKDVPFRRNPDLYPPLAMFADVDGNTGGPRLDTVFKKDPEAELCLATIVGHENANNEGRPWVLGSPFLRSWYTMFKVDNVQPLVGFVAATGGMTMRPIAYQGPSDVVTQPVSGNPLTGGDPEVFGTIRAMFSRPVVSSNGMAQEAR